MKTKVSDVNNKVILEPNEITVAAIEDGRRIAHDPNIKGYKSIDELKAALNE